MKDTRIGFIGAGNMAFSLIGGLLSSGSNSDLIWVTDKDSDKCSSVAKGFSINCCADNITLANSVDIIVLAVKPQVLNSVCEEIAESVETHNPLIISIAAGITTDSIISWLTNKELTNEELNTESSPASLVRCMPNTPALVQSGATALYATSAVNQQQRASAESIMRSVGITVWLEKETQMDAVTAISGSGPAYYFRFIEIMENSAVAMGLDQQTAHLLAVETAFGAAKMALESSDSPATLRKKVTSPGGTTEKALEIFTTGGLEQLIMDATQGAQQRSLELAKILGK